MVNGLFSQSILDWQAAAVAVFAAQSPALPAAQVMIGRAEWKPDIDFYKLVDKNGPYLVIELPDMGESNSLTFEGHFKVGADLFFSVPADVSYPFTKEYNFVAALMQGWTTHFAMWDGGEGNRNPLHIKFGKPVERFHEKPNIYSIKWEFTQPLVSAQVANPDLRPAP